MTVEVDFLTADLLKKLNVLWNARLERSGLPHCSVEHMARSLLAKATLQERDRLLKEYRKERRIAHEL